MAGKVLCADTRTLHGPVNPGVNAKDGREMRPFGGQFSPTPADKNRNRLAFGMSGIRMARSWQPVLMSCSSNDLLHNELNMRWLDLSGTAVPFWFRWPGQ